MFTQQSALAAFNSLVYLVTAISFTALFSSFPWKGNVMNTVNMVANLLGLGMAFLGGVFVPQNMLSAQVLMVGRFFPTYWYIRINNMLAGFSTEAYDSKVYWMAIGIELLFAVAAFTLVPVVTKMNRQKS